MVIPVNRNTAKMKNTCCTAHHITRYPKMTRYCPPRPVTYKVINYSKWHYKTSDCYICCRETEINKKIISIKLFNNYISMIYDSQ
jgi:hypothetical protein